jgi:phosphoribosylanthranilate isomerase
MLAGGLTPDNVFEAIKDVQPWAVDMSSGLETNHLKDPHKIRAAVAAVRMAAATMGADTITSEERNESIT